MTGTDLAHGVVPFDIFGDPPAPDSLLLRVLGLVEMPHSTEDVKSAFRTRLLQVHPDIGAGGTEAAESVSELAWAREVLLRRVAVTASTFGHDSPQQASQRSGPTCIVCGGERKGHKGRPYSVRQAFYSGRPQRWIGYCEACMKDAENERLREARAQVRAGRRCEECGDAFAPKRSDGRFCCAACRQTAYRKRVGRTQP
ncbi:MAG TPA: hypothetical protein VII76_10485 [Acidimicrobiales bacterium]